jgi:DNA-binding MarR family transcriptional regulator
MPVLSRRLWLDIQQVANQALSALEEEAASLDLKPRGMSVLVNVKDKPGSTATALADVSGLQASTLTGLIDKLEEAGLLKRKRDHDNDRREVSLHLTPEGSERAAQARAAMTRYERRVEALVTPEEMKAFRHVLSAIASNATTKASSA